MSRIAQKLEYKFKIISHKGNRVKGDDITDKLAENRELECNRLALDGWEFLSAVPTISSEGAVSKLLVTYKRKKV